PLLRVVQPVQLHERIKLVQVGDVVVQMQVRREVIAIVVLSRERIGERSQEIHAAVGSPPKILPHAEVRNQGKVSVVLIEARGPSGNLESQTQRTQSPGTVVPQKGPFRTKVDIGKDGFVTQEWVVRLNAKPAQLVHHKGPTIRDGQTRLGPDEL